MKMEKASVQGSLRALAGVILACQTMAGFAGRYEANWDSLNARPCPQWWQDAKFGVFIHWGVYSVPSFAPPDEKNVGDCYAEHYLNRGHVKKFVDYHARHYPNKSYQDLAAEFTAEHFDPAAWAELFRRSGAKYVVLTSKHHEGFALWPSKSQPYYNAMMMGPKRDLCGDLSAAVRAAGMHMGFYYSLFEWKHPLYAPETIDRFVAEVNIPQIKELVTAYKPDILWADGEWDYPWQTLRSPEILAWLYNESPVKDTVVANDRWGKDFRGKCGDHYTTEYDDGDTVGKTISHPWEECRGIGRSFGYNRFETAEHYLTDAGCIETLVEKVSRGGNLLLNVGPTADGRIPVIMQERLLAMGEWLKVNGEAIYGTRAWEKRPKTMRQDRIYYTAKGNDVYAICFVGPEKFRVSGLGRVGSVALLGSSRSIAWRALGDGIEIDMPCFRLGEAPCSHALVFRISQSVNN